ncbi:proline-rich protein 9 [Macrotis lagotis]|uniref:proline-rich protein 9 n=1 Tax=Macrotis lagotis TaxID=92651 RepID=UPI003D692C99
MVRQEVGQRLHKNPPLHCLLNPLNGPHSVSFAGELGFCTTEKMSFNEQQCKQPCQPPPCLSKTQEKCPVQAQEPCLPPCQEKCPDQAQEPCLPKSQDPCQEPCPQQCQEPSPSQCQDPCAPCQDPEPQCHEPAQVKCKEAVPQKCLEKCSLTSLGK